MPRLIKRTIKHANQWDWAYICVKANGKCEKCEMCDKGKCKFVENIVNGSYEDTVFTTRVFFTDYQKDLLLDYFTKIVEEKEKQHEKEKNVALPKVQWKISNYRYLYRRGNRGNTTLS